MPDFNTLMSDPSAITRTDPPAPYAKDTSEPVGVPLGTYDDQELLDLWSRIKKETLEPRWIFERQWHRNILYTLGRQWIEYYARQGGWKDKRMAQWIPRPVTNKCKETVQAIRAMFTSIRLGVNVRPNGAAPENVSAAATADELAPVLHETHAMNSVMTEFDFWLCVTGNAFLHTFMDYDLKHGTITVPSEQCLGCGAVYPTTKLVGGQPTCPDCGAHAFQPAQDEQGMPIETEQPKGQPSTVCLSPLELAFPNPYPRFDELPYVVRLRWRPKMYYENHPILKTLVSQIVWQKSPNDQSLQLFKSLSSHNDLGIAPAYMSDGGGAAGESEEGIAEYEVWYKPCDAYPEGLVFRVAGDSDPQIIHLEDTDALPGPLPYKDADGKPLFTFAHAGYEHVGGRVLASGPLDVIIQKQDQLNQLDSMILLIIQRMANPVWLKPKGAEIQQMTGMPGLVIDWNPLTVGGNAKPERIEGIGPHASLFTIREQYLHDIEELAGTFDIIKGAKPTGVEAFSALQLLVERSQSRFASVFGARGDAYRNWFKFAIELEREFGPEDRTKAILSPAKTWTFQNFKRSQLQGSMSVVVEDGSNVPKTSLGMRASIEHANQLGMLDMHDPDQRYEGLKLFGLTRMAPTLDIHVQAALQKQQAFEQWAMNPQNALMAAQTAMGQMQEFQGQLAQHTDPNMPLPVPPSPLAATPLKWHKWYNPQIHRQEFIKWANSDKIRELLGQQPGLEGLLEVHLAEINQAMLEEAVQLQAMVAPAPAAPQPGQGGAGSAMRNSNRESTQGNVPAGQGEGAQNQGPA